MTTIVVIDQPQQEPVSLQEVYQHLRFPPNITQHVDDARLKRLIKMAREQVETITRRSLCQQTLRAVQTWSHEEIAIGSASPAGGQIWASNWGLNNCIAPPLQLLRPPLLEVTAVQYYDAANVLRSVDVSSYRVNLPEALIEFVDGFSWPQVFDRSDAVSVQYIAGYPPADDGSGGINFAAGIPETIKEAILLKIECSYNAMLPAEEAVIDDRIESMLATYREWRF